MAPCMLKRVSRELLSKGRLRGEDSTQGRDTTETGERQDRKALGMHLNAIRKLSHKGIHSDIGRQAKESQALYQHHKGGAVPF